MALPSPEPRLCAVCGHPITETAPMLRDGYALHPQPCLADYMILGPRYTLSALRDASLILAYDLQTLD